MKKKILIWLGVAALVAALIVIGILTHGFRSLSVVTPSYSYGSLPSGLSTSVTIVQDTAQYTEYQLSWTGLANQYNIGSCGAPGYKNPFTLGFTINSEDDSNVYVSQLPTAQVGLKVNAQSVQLTGIKAGCGTGTSNSFPYNVLNQSAVCWLTTPGGQTAIVCNVLWKGEIPAGSPSAAYGWYGGVDGSITVFFPKAGYCVDNSQCSAGETCTGYTCSQPFTPTPSPTPVQNVTPSPAPVVNQTPTPVVNQTPTPTPQPPAAKTNYLLIIIALGGILLVVVAVYIFAKKKK